MNKYRKYWGFLINGIKDHFYYWEILIMYRKVLIIFVSTFAWHFGKAA